MNETDEYIARLCRALLSLETEEECRSFLDDICTPKEIEALSQRLEVARLLSRKITFTAIARRTSASSATISRVNRCLRGKGGGYATVLERIGTE